MSFEILQGALALPHPRFEDSEIAALGGFRIHFSGIEQAEIASCLCVW
jgi:hypothetical protein